MNVQQQFTGHSSRPQQKLTQPFFSNSKKRQQIQEAIKTNKIRSKRLVISPKQQAQARLHFTVAENQALVLRRLLLSTADLHLQELQMTPIASKRIVKIALILESQAIDKVIHAVIKNMQSAEIGSIMMA